MITQFKLFEAVIKPLDLDTPMEKLKEKAGDLESIEEINDIFKEVDVKFVEYKEFHDSLRTQREKDAAPNSSVQMLPGVKFAAFNPATKQMNVVVEPRDILRFLNGPGTNKFEKFYDIIRIILRHESIHKQQVSRMGKDVYSLSNNPSNDKEEYLKDRQEMMAYAQSLIDHLIDDGDNKQEILDKLKSGRIYGGVSGRIYFDMKDNLSRKDFNRFIKYVTQYLESMTDEEFITPEKPRMLPPFGREMRQGMPPGPPPRGMRPPPDFMRERPRRGFFN